MAPSVITRKERWTLDDFDPKPLALRSSSPQKTRRMLGHHKSDSQGSSLRFITTIRSATATVASTSIATISKRTTKWRHGQQRSSIISGSEPRPSVDSVRSVVDEAARLRSRKRREKLEELIRTEESYVADIKALSDAYFTILGHQATTTSFARRATQKVMADVLCLHDTILGELHDVVPFSEYDNVIANAPRTVTAKTHNRWHSVDVVPTRTMTIGHSALATIRQGRRSLNISRSTEDEQIILRCSPQVVAAVCSVFSKHLKQFVAYEEYGLNYEMVRRDIDEITRAIPTVLDYDKGYEALSAYIGPLNSRAANYKRAMTVKDLLIKPIQRIPRYELLFEDLRKLTPVYDDPSTHASICELLDQLKVVCTRTNMAKEDPTRAKKLEITTLIGSRLPCSAQVPRSVFLQLLGQVILCGCLHIAYRGRERIKGCYAICVLFESTLLFCAEDEEHSMWSILAAISLGNATLQETDNYKGLQCHTAPHSWKVVFEHHAKMYELMLTACSAIEAEVWRKALATGIEGTSQAVADGKANVLVLQSPLTESMRSVGKAFGKPGSFVRRMSVHRSATVGPTADLNQVIIKNTQAVKEVQDNNSQDSLQIPRSQSLVTPSHVQTLAPRRADRYRLEAILADVWSRDLLPYPGMMRRSDPIRAGANHVIRKFSMASITSNFSSSKRNPSYTSVNSWRKEDVAPSRAAKNIRRDSFNTVTSRSTKPLSHPVNFHTAPDAFLPADFELQDPSKSKKRSALRTFTMTMERPFSPLLGIENKQSTLRRAQSVRDIVDDEGPSATSHIPAVSVAPMKKSEPALYSISPDRTKTPVAQQRKEDLALKSEKQLPAKTPRKSKSRMFRDLFH
ncbi:putative DH domain-containing protein [Septoria linicola]|nr:putative DH domain-containing protein [Septoria linicola]